MMYTILNCNTQRVWTTDVKLEARLYACLDVDYSVFMTDGGMRPLMLYEI